MFTPVAQNAYISKAQRILITKAIQNSHHLSNTNFPELKMARFTLMGAQTSLQSYFTGVQTFVLVCF